MQKSLRFFAALVVAVALILAFSASAFADTITDDFSTFSGLWSYEGVASPDYADQQLTLTTDGQIGTNGQAWLTARVRPPFTASFSYYAGPNTGYSYGGADGFAFMFGKKKWYTPDSGGSLGFNESENKAVPGYGIEFDSYFDSDVYAAPEWARNSPHVALIKDTATNILAGQADGRVADDNWHDAVVTVGVDSVVVTIDGTEVVNWTGALEANYENLGFTAATGGLSNTHLIDNFQLDYTPVPDAPPANDDFAHATELTGSSGSQFGNTFGATEEVGEPDHNPDMSIDARRTIWYSWTAPSDCAVGFDTIGSEFDTILAAYTGTSVGNLTQLTFNDTYLNDNSSRVVFPAQAGVTYYIAIDGYYSGDVGITKLNWTTASPPTNDDFANAEMLLSYGGSIGGSVFGATREPGEPNHYPDYPLPMESVWYTLTPLSSARYSITAGDAGVMAIYTGDTVDALTPVDADAVGPGDLGFDAQAGITYRIAVAAPSFWGNPFTLAWWPIIVPPNDNFADAQPLPGARGGITATNLFASAELGEPPFYPSFTPSNSVWYSWTPTATGTIHLGAYSADFATLVALYTGGSLDALTQVDAAYGGAPLEWNGVAGTTYYICVDGDAGAGTFDMNWSTDVPPPNDNFSSATMLTGPIGSVQGWNDLATREPGEPEPSTYPGCSIWYSWTADADGPIDFNTLNSTFDTVLGIYTGNAVDNLTTVAINEDIDPDTMQSRVVFYAEQGTTYHIAIDTEYWDPPYGLTGFSTLAWGPANSPPNDDLADAQGIDDVTGSVLGTTIDCTKEPAEVLPWGRKSVWYEWTAPANGDATFAVDRMYHYPLVYSGTGSYGALVPVAEDDDWNSQLSFAATSGTTYYISVFSDDNSLGPFTLTWSMAATNQGPTCMDDTWTMEADTSAGIPATVLLANDTDPEGDPLRIIGAAPNTEGCTTQVGPGGINFTPPVGFTGEATFNYYVSDGQGNIGAAVVRVTVTPGAHPYTYTDPVTGVTLEFESVTDEGSSGVDSLTTSPPPPLGFMLIGQSRWDIWTTAAYTGTVRVTVPYDDTGLTLEQEQGLRLLHWREGDVPGWDNVTAPPVDTENNRISGIVDSFSHFEVVGGVPTPATGVLRGTVTSAEGGAPIEGVLVDAGALGTRTTGTDGSYEFPAATVGDYTVTCTRSGFIGGSATVTVAQGMTTTQDFVLEQQASPEPVSTPASSGWSLALLGTAAMFGLRGRRRWARS